MLLIVLLLNNLKKAFAFIKLPVSWYFFISFVMDKMVFFYNKTLNSILLKNIKVPVSII